MLAHIVYVFESGQVASRFLNCLKSGDIEGVKARLFKGSRGVQVSYPLQSDAGFNTTCAELDDLAASMGGQESSL